VPQIVTSAPAKVIFFGEHGVNRQQPALATAVDLRLYCHITTQADDHYHFRSGDRQESYSRADLLADKTAIDELRLTQNYDAIRERARAFFAPTRYVLAHVIARYGGPGLSIEWRSTLPVGSGLGSGAAAAGAMALAAGRAAGYELTPIDVAFLAWQGDVVAHGGVASGLDSGASALGGLTLYTLTDGPRALPYDLALPLVIGYTGVQANTAEINTRVRHWLATHPARMHLFAEIGLLVRQAQVALATQDRATLGHLLNLNQLILEKIGVSCPELEQLIEAALAAGALGAKLSGSGGGGIMIALVEPEQQGAVAAAIEAAGGRAYALTAGAPGVRVESEISA
jgi:mevalonate kinase